MVVKPDLPAGLLVRVKARRSANLALLLGPLQAFEVAKRWGC